jgi:hypothetical protein
VAMVRLLGGLGLDGVDFAVQSLRYSATQSNGSGTARRDGDEGTTVTLLLASPIAFMVGLLLGRRRLAYGIVALVWYACLAIQTAHLAHPGTDGFFGVDGLDAVQGRSFGQYWLSQVPIAVLVGALLAAGAAARRRRAGRVPIPGH